MSFKDASFNDWITLILNNFGLALLILAVLIAIIDWPIARFRKKHDFYEVFFRWIVLLPLGIASLYGFIMHAFFPVSTAALIGWTNSPFQFEVAMANLGIGIIAVIAFRASYGFRLATVIASACWLWGDALGHIYQMAAHQNYQLGNSGSWLWMDLIIPAILIVCIVKMRHCHASVKTTHHVSPQPTTNFGNLS